LVPKFKKLQITRKGNIGSVPHSSKALMGRGTDPVVHDILKAISEKHEFEYQHDKLIKLSREIKVIIEDKAKYKTGLIGMISRRN
jgi:hypothetical protein